MNVVTRTYPIRSPRLIRNICQEMQHVATTHLGSDFERVVVQKLWRLESLVEQVETLPHLEKPILSLVVRKLHVCFQEP